MCIACIQFFHELKPSFIQDLAIISVSNKFYSGLVNKKANVYGVLLYQDELGNNKYH